MCFLRLALHQHNSLWGPLKQTDTLVTAYYHSNSPLQLCVNGHQCILLRWVNDSGTIRQTALSAPTPSNETTQSATESPWQILAKCKSLFNQQRDSSTLHTDKHLSLRTPDPFILILAWLSVSEVNPISHCVTTGNNLVYVYVCVCVWVNVCVKAAPKSYLIDHSDTDSDYTQRVTGRYSTSFLYFMCKWRSLIRWVKESGKFIL